MVAYTIVVVVIFFIVAVVAISLLVLVVPVVLVLLVGLISDCFNIIDGGIIGHNIKVALTITWLHQSHFADF